MSVNDLLSVADQAGLPNEYDKHTIYVLKVGKLVFEHVLSKTVTPSLKLETLPFLK